VGEVFVSELWTASLKSFSDDLSGTQPVPAGVAAAAVSGSLGLALLIKVLEIAGKKHLRPDSLIEAARRESAQLITLAGQDAAAFRSYLDARRQAAASEDDSGRDAAVRCMTEIPLKAARAAAAGLDICVEAGGLVHALVAADLGAAASLLAGAVRAMLICVDFNLGEVRSDAAFCEQVSAQCRELEERAQRQAEAVLQVIARLRP
jgi:formiminotetrahydrofolate cyclodeaminase